MDMRSVVVVFFAIIILLTLIGLVTPGLPPEINTALSVLIIIFSIFAIISVLFSRNKSYYPY